MVTFNNRINNNRPHKYQKSATGDRDANAQNAYRQQAQKEDDSQQSQPDTEEDLNKTISFLDKKEKVIIKNLENSSVIDPNLSLNKELKDLITRINIKSQDKVNSEYLNDLLCDFSKIKDNKKQEEILRLLQSIANRIHTVHFQEILGKQILRLLNNNPYFSETIITIVLALYEQQVYILKQLKYHSIFAPEYSKILEIKEKLTNSIIDYFINKSELPNISYNSLKRISVIFTNNFSLKDNIKSQGSLEALVRLLTLSINSSTTREQMKFYLKLFKKFKTILKEKEDTRNSKISTFFSSIFFPKKPINLINSSIKKILAILKKS
jgi:hypothetical protein